MVGSDGRAATGQGKRKQCIFGSSAIHIEAIHVGAFN
jgi:hypothetical protein